MLIAFIFAVIILPALGWGWYDYSANRQAEPSYKRKSLIALSVTSLSGIGFVGTTLALTRYGNPTGYFRIAVGGALLSCCGIALGSFTRPLSKKFLLAGAAVVTLLFWSILAIVVLPVS